MTILLPSVALSTTPVVLKTFIQHYITQFKKHKEDKRTEAKDEFMFHEAFAIVKHFIEIATHDTAEALQRFTNTKVPSPPNASSLRLLVPMTSCNQAAAMLIEYFGEEELKNIVGGSRWWQVRGLKGVQGEWIAMKEDWRRAQKVIEREAEDGNDEYLKKRAKEVGLNQRHERKKSHTSIPKIKRNKSSTKSVKKARTSQEGDTASESEHVLDEGKDEPLESFEELDRLKRVMYYIHGGGYYFGSINTHRLMITRFARKFGGRAFAIQYRKSPQYPWPCPLQDILAGYLYLIDPPPEARHKAIDPAHIVIAGDSAGGGLALALLGVLRDLNKPMPAGAVLLSPWCDLTHSFPSILQNTETDIIPKYSFIHKPSTLWPVPGVRPEDKQKTASVKASGGEKNTDASSPPGTSKSQGIFQKRDKEPDMNVLHGVEKDVQHGKAREEGKIPRETHYAVQKGQIKPVGESKAEGEQPSPKVQGKGNHKIPEPLEHLYSDKITIPMEDKDNEDVNIELRQQIQLYATNAQLYHPLCSPILQGSLGGLPPLYILAGDSEVLRDEIIYLAHRAARPEQYQLKKELLEASPRCREDAERFNSQPTKVHLQVYDGQPHVLTLFSFTTSSRFAYRAIASFVKHVTGAPTNVINPFPHLEASTSLGNVPSDPKVHKTMVLNKERSEDDIQAKPQLSALDTSDAATQVDEPETMTPIPQTGGSVSTDSTQNPSVMSTPVDAPVKGESLRQKRRNDVKLGIQNAYDGQVPLRRPTYVQEMIRERVDIRGLLRPLEEEHLLQALQMPLEDIGRIKAGPVSRYLTGQELWDKKYRRTAKRVDKERAKNEARAYQMLEQAAKEGLLESMPRKVDSRTMQKGGEQADSKWFEDGWADLAAFGPLDLEGEVPPPSAIAGRRDTPDALELIRQSLHMRAYRLRNGKESVETATKVTYGDDRAGLRGKTKVKLRQRAGSGYRQSAAERQVESKTSYGVKAWGDAMNYFSGRSSEKSKNRMRQYGRYEPKQANSEGGKQRANGTAAAHANEDWVDSASNSAINVTA